jgi:hypothetical protein
MMSFADNVMFKSPIGIYVPIIGHCVGRALIYRNRALDLRGIGLMGVDPRQSAGHSTMLFVAARLTRLT